MGGGAQYRKNSGGSIRNAIKNPLTSINKPWGDMTKAEKQRMIVGLLQQGWDSETRYKEWGKRYKIAYDAASGTTKIADKAPNKRLDDDAIMVVSNTFRFEAAEKYEDYENTNDMGQWLSRHPDLIDLFINQIDKNYDNKFVKQNEMAFVNVLGHVKK